MDAFTESAGPANYCDEGLQLRHKVQKLRWMGFEHEGDALTHKIETLCCGLPQALVPPHYSTD